MSAVAGSAAVTYPPPESLPIACERFDRSQPSLFDTELDQIVCAGALERKSLQGFDNVVGAPARFTVASNVFREDLVSGASRSIGRHRSIVCALSTVVFGGAGWPLPRIVAELNDRCWSVYLAERNTPLFEYFAAHMEAGRFTFSEYCGDGLRSGDVVDGIRHEDLQATSFPDAAFDLVITSEVLEHVPHAPQAEREIMRILRTGGAYVFTVPLDAYGDGDTILAELLADGSLKFHGEPVYHGDPYRAEGILAYRIFSVADLERRFAAAGGDCVTWRFWSKALGILGCDSWVHVVSKS